MFKIKENLLEKFTQLVNGSKVQLATEGVVGICSSCSGRCGNNCTGTCAGSCKGTCTGSCQRYRR